MQAHKVTFTNTKLGEVLLSTGYEGKSFRIQGVFYSSNNPSAHLYIYDKDNDIIAHPIPGQMEAKLINLEPITCKLPIKILDEAADSKVVIYGELL